MKYYFRALGYVKLQYKAVIAEIFCALLVAILFAASLMAMLPIMKVLMGEEGLPGWINRSIVQSRGDLTFEQVGGAGNIAEAEKNESDNVFPLIIRQVKKKGIADKSGLEKGDSVISIIENNTAVIEQGRRDLILERLAWAEAGATVQLLVQRAGGDKETIPIKLSGQPFYAPAAQWLLGFVPREQGVEFKRNSIILIIVLIMIATIIRCTLRFTQDYLVRRIGFRSIMYLRRDAYEKAIRLPMNYFNQQGVSDIISRVIKDGDKVNDGIVILFGKAVREPLKITGLALGAFWINWQMTLIVIMVVPIAVLIISKLGSKIKKATRRTLESWSRVLSHLQETLQGIRVVKGYHQENQEENNFVRINKKLLKQQFRIAKISTASGPLVESLGITAACAGMIVAAFWLSKGDMETSDFFTIIVLLGTLAESGRKLGNVYTRLQTADESAKRIYQIIDAEIEHDLPSAKDLGRLKEYLEFRNFSFYYPDTTIPALDSISLRIKAGETVAVVGPNGSGKTTLLSMIPRFFPPHDGEIYIDGIDIEQVTLKSLREQIGIVTQKSIIFDDTIANNIAYGNPQAPKEEIVSAAQQAYAHEFIVETDQGYQTIVGEQGTRLSGGQLQRLTIARAILRDPAILIFDEAMSQIDTESEAKIQKALAEFSRGRTSFIIAHRLSTIVDSDRIVVLDKGKLVAEGNHQSLLESCNLYRKLYEVQFVDN